jgi:hypothetical protein
MSVLTLPSCPDDCTGLPLVDFDVCAPEIHYGEVSKIYIAAADADPFTNIELLPEWTARLSETSVDPDAIRPLTVLGDLPVAEQSELTISGDRTVVGYKQFVLNFEVDETNGVNYNFMLTAECNLSFLIWFETSDGVMYGGNEGILATVRLSLMIPRERTDIVKYMGTAKWKSVFSPLRSHSPF